MKNTIKIGVEIEFKEAKASKIQRLLRDNGIQSNIEGYHSNRDFSVWKIASDSSVSRGYGNSMRGGEMVSPILTEETLSQIDTVCSVLQQANAEVNHQCGLHIHLSWENMEGKTIKKIVDRYKKFEKEIDSFMPMSRRTSYDSNGNIQRENGYCRSLINISTRSYTDENSIDYFADMTNRTSKVNTTGLGGRTGTIEFRHHSGTINAFKIKNWIAFLMDFVAESDNKKNEFGSRTENQITSKKKTNKFTEVNNALRKFGSDLSWNGSKWQVASVHSTKLFTTAELRGLYNYTDARARTIDSEKLEQFLNNIVGSEDNLWTNVEDKIKYYFAGRSDLLGVA